MPGSPALLRSARATSSLPTGLARLVRAVHDGRVGRGRCGLMSGYDCGVVVVGPGRRVSTAPASSPTEA